METVDCVAIVFCQQVRTCMRTCGLNTYLYVGICGGLVARYIFSYANGILASGDVLQCNYKT
jgi:hypothetical protein